MIILILSLAGLVFIISTFNPSRIEDDFTSSPSLPIAKDETKSAIPIVYPKSDVAIRYPKQLRTKRAHRKRCLEVQLPPAHIQHVTKKEIQAYLQSVREVDQLRNKIAI